MANEFIIKNGFHSKGGSQVTGSLDISVTASAGHFSGDGSGLTNITATTADTASYVAASNIDGNVATSSFALTSSLGVKEGTTLKLSNTRNISFTGNAVTVVTSVPNPNDEVSVTISTGSVLTPTLQEVTDQGATTTNDIQITGSLEVSGSGFKVDTSVGTALQVKQDGTIVLGANTSGATLQGLPIGYGAAIYGGVRGVAVGYQSSAASNSVGIGGNASAAGAGNAVVVGGYASATANKTVAIGYDADVSGIHSIAIGSYINASGTNSITLNSSTYGGAVSTSTANSFEVYMTSNSTPDFQVTNTHITASGNISGSSISTASFGTYLGDGSNLTNLPSSSPFPLTASSAAIISRSIASGDTDSTALRLIGSGSISESGIFEVEGSAGPLFSVADGLDGILMEVNNISGLPLFQVSSSNEVFVNRGNLTSGVTTATASFANFSGSFQGDGSNLTGISASPAGNNQEVQFNNAGTLAGNANFKINNSTGIVSMISGAYFNSGNSGIIKYTSATEKLAINADEDSVNIEIFGYDGGTKLRMGDDAAGDGVTITSSLGGVKIKGSIEGDAQFTLPKYNISSSVINYTDANYKISGSTDSIVFNSDDRAVTTRIKGSDGVGSELQVGDKETLVSGSLHVKDFAITSSKQILLNDSSTTAVASTTNRILTPTFGSSGPGYPLLIQPGDSTGGTGGAGGHAYLRGGNATNASSAGNGGNVYIIGGTSSTTSSSTGSIFLKGNKVNLDNTALEYYNNASNFYRLLNYNSSTQFVEIGVISYSASGGSRRQVKIFSDGEEAFQIKGGSGAKAILSGSRPDQHTEIIATSGSFSYLSGNSPLKIDVGSDTLEIAASNFNVSTAGEMSSGTGDGISTTNVTSSGAISSSGTITGNSFVKGGGTSAQFLKANGSVDSNTYLTAFTVQEDGSNVETGTTKLNFTGNAVSAATDGVDKVTLTISTGSVSVTGTLPFTGSAGISGSLEVVGSGSGLFSVEGSVGSLFTVNDGLDDVIFAANNISGTPVIEASADNTVKLGKLGGFGIVISGSTPAPNDSQAKIIITGSIHTSGSLGVGMAASSTIGRIDAKNDVVAFSTSDERLKDNITPIENALNKVSQVQGIEFDWIEKEGVHGNEGHDVGVIAQEIEKVLPEVVTTRDNGYKAVKYEKIIPLLVEAIKELQAEVQELKNSK